MTTSEKKSAEIFFSFAATLRSVEREQIPLQVICLLFIESSRASQALLLCLPSLSPSSLSLPPSLLSPPVVPTAPNAHIAVRQKGKFMAEGLFLLDGESVLDGD